MQEFLDKSLPGILASDIVTTLVWLMTSKNPDQGQILRSCISAVNLSKNVFRELKANFYSKITDSLYPNFLGLKCWF
jgi:hypothetical protein